MYPNKILIVEDDPLWQSFLQEPLEDEYALTVVSTRGQAKEALDKAKAAGRPFDLVTVDIGLENDMPTLDGEALLKFVNQYHRRTKCIVVTGHQSVGMAQLRDYFTKFEVFDYVGKADFDLDHFKEVVDRAFYKYGYRILSELGRGGMGTVYKALHPGNAQQVVALKVLHNDSSIATKELERRLARFRKEVETARRLVHPNIVKVIDIAAGEESKRQFYFVMEYLQGDTLQEILAENSPLSENMIINIGCQLCDALSYAHQQHIVHRDVKPSNIILLPDGQVKITDFGIAKVLNADSSLTKTEDVVGTLEYMPPEQILNAKAVDPRVDIYAVGAVLYELLSRRRMYSDPMKKLQYDSTPLQQLKPNLPGWLVKAVMKAVDREPDHRFQTAAEMARVLKAQKDEL